MEPTTTFQVTTPSEREVALTRTFDAPRTLVFDAITKPELLARWYGPTGWSLVVCEIDLRVGGRWRYVTRRPNGTEVGQHGVYQEIEAPARIVNTESWEDWNPGEVLVTTTLTEAAGLTTMTCTMCFPSQAVRDQLLAAGMTSGAADSYDKLAACLASLG